MHRIQINKGKASYNPNSIGGGCPFQAMISEGGFSSFEERIDSNKIRRRSKSFFDHFSQPELFYKSMSNDEKRHIQNAFAFELGKVKIVSIRQRVVDMLLEVDQKLAQIVGNQLGLIPKKLPQPITDSIPADGDLEHYHSFKEKLPIKDAPSLSMAKKLPSDIEARRVAILTADGVADEAFTKIKKELCDLGAMVAVIAPRHGFVTTKSGDQYPIDESLLTAASVVFDAMYIPGGESATALSENADAVHFVAEAFKHCKPISSEGDGKKLLEKALPQSALKSAGISTTGKFNEFVENIKLHRFWNREIDNNIPA
jgi:catalase